jgi:tRNA(His) 5'-end guanylyltransferase
MTNEALGTRMKVYEAPYQYLLPRRTYTIVRVDGRAFHTYLKDANRPFDVGVADAMDEVATALCKEMAGSVFAYTQSDEVSVLLTDFARLTTSPWFNGEVQKISSVAASIATSIFNLSYSPKTGETAFPGRATFDARVYTIPQTIEVANYFVWRQQDAVRNAVSMAARAYFTHSECRNKTGAQLQEMLFLEKRINFNDYPARFKRGGVVTKETEVSGGSYTDKRTGLVMPILPVPRKLWVMGDAPHFTAAPNTFLSQQIPGYNRSETLTPSLEVGDLLADLETTEAEMERRGRTITALQGQIQQMERVLAETPQEQAEPVI